MGYWLVFLLPLISSGLGQRIVDTQYGQVRSHVVNVHNGREQTTVDVYYGIPYANDTSGANRFKSPVPPASWTGILEADTIGPSCPQSKFPGFDVSEDCLKMNIYAPTNTSQTYAVMVWLHGGGYHRGANFEYPGHFLATHGVIVVTLNYRLGRFGYAYTGNEACPGNAGMWDQAIGLQFVVDNIANFGGDPNRITLFGESAGASSTSLHVLSPATNKLFQQAIVQSGSELVFWGLNPPDSHPENYTYAMADSVGCARDDDNEMIECMQDLPWREIYYNASFGGCAPGFLCLGMVPVVDGPGGFMPQHPGLQRQSGDVMQGPMISGINKEDGSLYALAAAPELGSDTCCNRSYFEHVLRDNMVDYFSPRLTDQTEVDLYEALNWNYSPWPEEYDSDQNRFALVELVTDVSFGLAWDRQVKDHSAVAPTYSYLYDYLSNRTSLDEWIGTWHGAELSFVFGYPLLRSNPEVEEDCGWTGRIPTLMDLEFTYFMQELWTNFAKTGNPTPTPVQNPMDGGLYTWPEFTFNDMNYLYMGDTDIDNRLNYRQHDYYFWQNYIAKMAGEELDVIGLFPIDDITDGTMATNEMLAEMVEHFREYLPDYVKNSDDYDYDY